MKLIDEDDEIQFRFYRLGKRIDIQNPRPLKLMFNHSGIKEQIFAAAKNLKGLEKWKHVSIASDLTKKQQELGKLKREEFLQEAIDKNNKRSDADINEGVEYKVMGSYGLGTLRVQRTKPPKGDESE